MQNRTHTCDELRLSDAGKRVQLSGWMDSVRIVSANLAFVILRDFYGTTQVVIDDEEQMKIIRSLNKESVISVTGIVRERDNKNPKIPTGDIEVEPEKIDVLGRCRYNELPFQINRSREADESIRLKYRYLDLRNPDVKKNIVMRCNVVTALRQAMNEHGFLEITTPILTASSPEGARDYLVPARKHPGMFYALPQAPQQFKQLLMTKMRAATAAPASSISWIWKWRLRRRRMCSASLKTCCRPFSPSTAHTTPRPARPSSASPTTTRWSATARISLTCALIWKCRT